MTESAALLDVLGAPVAHVCRHTEMRPQDHPGNVHHWHADGSSEGQQAWRCRCGRGWIQRYALPASGDGDVSWEPTL